MNINATLIGQSISFFVFVWFVMKYVWPPLLDALNERKKKIADGLAAAERGQREHELAEQRAKQILHEAKEQAAVIINQAQQREREMIDESRGKAETEAEKVMNMAQSEIEQERNSAREQLRGQLSSLVLSGVQQILKREVSEDDHREVLNSLSAKL